jgi:hypothetical protein
MAPRRKTSTERPGGVSISGQYATVAELSRS